MADEVSSATWRWRCRSGTRLTESFDSHSETRASQVGSSVDHLSAPDQAIVMLRVGARR